MPALTDDAWAQIRQAYENTERPVADICAEHGVSTTTLRDRMRRWRWTRRRPPISHEGPAAALIHETHDHPPPEGKGQESAPPTTAPNDTDPASIAPRLQSAVARVLPAIETIIARLAAGPLPPRETEQTARALGTLTRTLRELNALLAQQPLRAAEPYDDLPEDMDAFRERLARRIDAFFASRPDETFEVAPATTPEATAKEP